MLKIVTNSEQIAVVRHIDLIAELRHERPAVKIDAWVKYFTIEQLKDVQATDIDHLDEILTEKVEERVAILMLDDVVDHLIDGADLIILKGYIDWTLQMLMLGVLICLIDRLDFVNDCVALVNVVPARLVQ